MGNPNYIALTGKSGSGKTTLAKALEQEGYTLINFTDNLKIAATVALNELGFTPMLTVEAIKKDKEKFRPFLQELGVLIGYDTEAEYVIGALEDWQKAECPKCVFDNVRTFSQWSILKQYDFTLVELKEEEKTLTIADIFYQKPYVHPIEQGFYEEDKLVLQAHMELEYMVWRLSQGEKLYREAGSNS